MKTPQRQPSPDCLVEQIIKELQTSCSRCETAANFNTVYANKKANQMNQFQLKYFWTYCRWQQLHFIKSPRKAWCLIGDDLEMQSIKDTMSDKQAEISRLRQQLARFRTIVARRKELLTKSK